MKFINGILLKDSDYSGLLNDIKKERLPLACTGLSLITKAAVIRSIHSHTERS